jgi:hypothetical protein
MAGMDETKRVVVEDYPADQLPDEVREHFAAGGRVVLTVESKPVEPARRTIAEILDDMQNARVFLGDPVQRIRALRAEWDHRDELHARIRRGEKI